MKIAFVFAAVMAALGAATSPSGAAIESGWDASPEARARLISGVSATGVAGAAPLALEFVLKPGWKTYWRAPGPQGYPPRLDWAGSENVDAAEIVWPTPKRFTILGYDSIGYEGGAILPLNVRFIDPSRPARLELTVDYLTCAEICIPQLAKLSLALPAGPAEPTAHAFAIDKARGQAPAPAGAGHRVERVWLDGPSDQPVLAVEIESTADPSAIDLFTDGLDGYFFRAPTVEQIGEGRIRLRSVAIDAPPTPAGVGQEAIYTVRLGDGRAFEQRLALSPPPSGVASGQPVVPIGLALMLGVAFLGGLILNVMPCVLPVLAIKLMGALDHAARGRRQVRRGFLASAAGIVVAFAVLAAGAVALRSAGVAVGWGIQFQQPLFVAFMATVMALFAANLWGLFEFGAPAAVGRASAALPERPGSLSGAFWTGVLATALATPCSAPFVGTALSFALTRGTIEIFAIFLTMGLGLAAPYLATAAFPSIARMLPRPGAWMRVVRRVLAVAVALTGAWLLWVLWRQAGDVAAALALAGAVLVVLLAAAMAPGRRWAGAGAAMAAGLAAVWLTAAAPAPNGGTVDWARFDEAEIGRRVADGAVVLVDVTADWCVTCQWNKATVLERDPTAAMLGAAGVLAMQADWTRPDPAITDYLARHGRFGIPFNIVYGPGAPAGVPLPELLNADAVRLAVEKARGAGG